MSTVLWANRLANGGVTTDESDKYALFKHLSKLDAVCKRCDVMLLSEMCDYTDMRFNVEDIELPAGMTSTDEMMARSGVWIEARTAIEVLRALMGRIADENIRFGLLRNDQRQVLSELEESLAFAGAAARENARFNFSAVM